MRASNTPLLPLLGVAMTFLAASCTRPSPELPGPPVVLDVAMREYRFDLALRTIPRGQVVVRGRNVGDLDHEVVLLGLPKDLPSIADQLRSAERRAVDTIAIMPARAPGNKGVFAALLPPGRYALACFVEDADGTNHLGKGMSAEFRVR